MVWKLVAGLALLVVVGVGVSVAIGTARWRETVRERDDALVSGQLQGDRIPREALPEPVARYLANAVPAGAPDISVARLRQEGTFQMGEGEDGWRPFTGLEVMRAVEPGFYWDAVIRMAPGVGVRIRDSYVSGSAEMVGRILGVVTVVDAPDERSLREGALSRYLAEAAWMPTRLGLGPGLTWAPVDDSSAEATLTDGETSVTLRFTFDASDDLVEVHGLRQREENGAYVETPWVGRFRDHAEVDGYRIPTYGEVAWVIDGEERLYWKGRILSAEFTPFSN